MHYSEIEPFCKVLKDDKQKSDVGNRGRQERDPISTTTYRESDIYEIDIENHLNADFVWQLCRFHLAPFTTGVYHESGLMELEEEGAPSEEITSTATQLRAEAVLKGQPVLKRALAGHLQNGYLPYLEHYLLQAQPHRAARRYARTCAWAQFICEQERFIAERSSPEEAELHLRSLHANLLHLLSQSDLEISVPRSEIYYQSWWRQLRDGLLQGKAPSDCIATVRQGNQNSRKLHEPAQAYLKQLYCSGAAPPIMHIYRQLVAQARKQGWWTDAKGFRPPSYRTVATYLQLIYAYLQLIYAYLQLIYSLFTLIYNLFTTYLCRGAY